MKWRDLSITSKCIIEQCWDVYTDKPQEFTMKIDKNFKIWVGINEGYNYYRFTEEVYNEIVKYHKEGNILCKNLENQENKKVYVFTVAIN